MSAYTDSDVPIDKSVWVRVLREFLRLKDAVLSEERSRDSRDAGGWVLVHKDLARAILAWRKECGKVHGWAGEEQDLGEDLMNQGKELMEEINGGVVSVVSEFAVTYLDDKMREMDAALAVLEPCAGGVMTAPFGSGSWTHQQRTLPWATGRRSSTRPLVARSSTGRRF